MLLVIDDDNDNDDDDAALSWLVDSYRIMYSPSNQQQSINNNTYY